jgi:hypothetical protein
VYEAFTSLYYFFCSLLAAHNSPRYNITPVYNTRVRLPKKLNIGHNKFVHCNQVIYRFPLVLKLTALKKIAGMINSIVVYIDPDYLNKKLQLILRLRTQYIFSIYEVSKQCSMMLYYFCCCESYNPDEVELVKYTIKFCVLEYTVMFRREE